MVSQILTDRSMIMKSRWRVKLLPWLLPFCHDQLVRVVHICCLYFLIELSPPLHWNYSYKVVLFISSMDNFYFYLIRFFKKELCTHSTHFFLEQTLLGFPVLSLFCVFVLQLPWTLPCHYRVFHYLVFLWWQFSGHTLRFFPINIWALGDFICSYGFRSFCQSLLN